MTKGKKKVKRKWQIWLRTAGSLEMDIILLIPLLRLRDEAGGKILLIESLSGFPCLSGLVPKTLPLSSLYPSFPNLLLCFKMVATIWVLRTGLVLDRIKFLEII